MASDSELAYERMPLRVDGMDLRIATVCRGGGDLAPIVFLHGFGSTKEDYVAQAYDRRFAGRLFLAYDAPGCGEKISIPFLVKTAEAVLERLNISLLSMASR